jgi:hypothetical protein
MNEKKWYVKIQIHSSGCTAYLNSAASEISEYILLQLHNRQVLWEIQTAGYAGDMKVLYLWVGGQIKMCSDLRETWAWIAGHKQEYWSLH